MEQLSYQQKLSLYKKAKEEFMNAYRPSLLDLEQQLLDNACTKEEYLEQLEEHRVARSEFNKEINDKYPEVKYRVRTYQQNSKDNALKKRLATITLKPDSDTVSQRQLCVMETIVCGLLISTNFEFEFIITDNDQPRIKKVIIACSEVTVKSTTTQFTNKLLLQSDDFTQLNHTESINLYKQEKASIEKDFKQQTLNLEISLNKKEITKNKYSVELIALKEKRKQLDKDLIDKYPQSLLRLTANPTIIEKESLAKKIKNELYLTNVDKEVVSALLSVNVKISEMILSFHFEFSFAISVCHNQVKKIQILPRAVDSIDMDSTVRILPIQKFKELPPRTNMLQLMTEIASPRSNDSLGEFGSAQDLTTECPIYELQDIANKYIPLLDLDNVQSYAQKIVSEFITFYTNNQMDIVNIPQSFSRIIMKQIKEKFGDDYDEYQHLIRLPEKICELKFEKQRIALNEKRMNAITMSLSTMKEIVQYYIDRYQDHACYLLALLLIYSGFRQEDIFKVQIEEIIQPNVLMVTGISKKKNDNRIFKRTLLCPVDVFIPLHNQAKQQFADSNKELISSYTKNLWGRDFKLIADVKAAFPEGYNHTPHDYREMYVHLLHHSSQEYLAQDVILFAKQMLNHDGADATLHYTGWKIVP